MDYLGRAMSSIPNWAMERAQEIMTMPWWHKDIARALVRAKEEGRQEYRKQLQEARGMEKHTPFTPKVLIWLLNPVHHMASQVN